MFTQLWSEWWSWWAVLTPEWRFLVGLPFIVALSAFASAQARRMRGGH